MKERGKNKYSPLSEFQRFVRGEMTRREENAFRRRLRDDTFTERAIEGFPEISLKKSDDNPGTPGKQLKKNFRFPKRLVFYSTSALAIVLVTISSLFFILDRNKQARQPGSNIAKPVPMGVVDSIKNTEYLLAGSNNLSGNLEIEAQQGIKNDLIDSAKSAGNMNTVIPENPDVSAITPAKDSNLYNTENKISATAEEFRMQAIPGFNVKGKILSSANRLPIAGVKVILKGTSTGTITDTEGYFKLTLPDETNRTLVANIAGMESKEFQAINGSEMQIELNPSTVALNEAAVYVIAKKPANEMTGYNPPQPVTGGSTFNRYIVENMKRPLVQPQEKDLVVVVSFVIRSTGTVDSLKVINSPGDEFSKEAIRLIREGPAWKPAEENGNSIDDKVSVRIVFK